MGKFASDETLIKEGGETIRKVFDEGGKTIRNRSDNKTKRYESDNSTKVEIHKSDNNTGVEHHKLNISNINNIMNNVLNGIDALSSSFAKVNDSINDRVKTNKEHEARLEELRNDREEIDKALEEAKNNFKQAMLDIEKTSEDRMAAFNKGVDLANDAWNKMFDFISGDKEIFMSESGKKCLANMDSLQERINKLSSELINSVNNK